MNHITGVPTFTGGDSLVYLTQSGGFAPELSSDGSPLRLDTTPDQDPYLGTPLEGLHDMLPVGTYGWLEGDADLAVKAVKGNQGLGDRTRIDSEASLGDRAGDYVEGVIFRRPK